MHENNIGLYSHSRLGLTRQGYVRFGYVLTLARGHHRLQAQRSLHGWSPEEPPPLKPRGLLSRFSTLTTCSNPAQRGRSDILAVPRRIGSRQQTSGKREGGFSQGQEGILGGGRGGTGRPLVGQFFKVTPAKTWRCNWPCYW